jgi:hypothetical protein
MALITFKFPLSNHYLPQVSRMNQSAIPPNFDVNPAGQQQPYAQQQPVQPQQYSYASANSGYQAGATAAGAQAAAQQQAYGAHGGYGGAGGAAANPYGMQGGGQKSSGWM